MEKEARITYEAPSIIVLDVKVEGVICISGGLETNSTPIFNGFNAEEEW